MPIRPENAARYPRDWKTRVVPNIRHRSGNRCECTGECGIDHDDIPDDGRCMAKNGGRHPRTGAIVVLTVAHLDHTPENCADENLLHLCQQCHNRLDAPMRRAGIKERTRAKMADGDLFEPSRLRIYSNGYDVTDQMPMTRAFLEEQRKRK